MKHSILILTILISFCYYKVTGQCIANAGPDRIICTNMNGVDTTQIGTTPAATGGTTPYAYSWEANYTITIGSTAITKTASDYLNDTTIATPLIIASEDNPVTFILTVTDSVGNICKDTTVIRFSRFMFTLGYLTFNIAQGDSVFLNYGTNVSSNFPPFQYLWKPNQGLTDSTSLSFWAKPNSSPAYYVTLTDSAGCSIESAPYYYVNVSAVGINETANNKFWISTYPNPTNDIINISIVNENNRNLVFDFFDSKGQLLKKTETKSNTLVLKTDTFSNGPIFFKITDQGQLVGQGKFIVK
jgi:hypothetical protein